jgi:hypothetical protein
LIRGIHRHTDIQTASWYHESTSIFQNKKVAQNFLFTIDELPEKCILYFIDIIIFYGWIVSDRREV